MLNFIKKTDLTKIRGKTSTDSSGSCGITEILLPSSEQNSNGQGVAVEFAYLLSRHELMVKDFVFAS